MEERKNIFLIFKEAVFNCVKYSGTRQLDISISQLSSSRIKMVIRDYGKGLSGSGLSGNGVRNMKQRADELKAKLEIRSDAGVEITLIL
jgi:two-component system, NarL family, sensor histidine kinase UhpB